MAGMTQLLTELNVSQSALCIVSQWPATAVEQTCSTGTCTGKISEAEYKGEWYGEFFPNIPKIQYEGPDSKNPLSFRYYKADEVIMGKTMADW